MKRALLIGLNYKGTSYELNGCINDVMNIKRLLLFNGYEEKNIVVLADNNPHRMPTRANILNELSKLTTLPSSEIFVHYSGHGSRVRDVNGDETSRLDSVIVPCDVLSTNVILDDVLFQYVSKFKCKSILLFDSCNSGSVCDLPYMMSYNNGRIIQSTTKRIVKMTNPSVYMISGCRDNQYSEDAYSNGIFYGAFTNAFLRSIQPNKPILSIYVDTCQKLPSSQVPVLSMSAPMIIKTQPPIITRTIVNKYRTINSRFFMKLKR
jgi:hypothetical protein